MIGKNKPTNELNLEILFCVDIFSPVSILEPLFLGVSPLAQELTEPKMFRPDRMIVLFRIFGRWPPDIFLFDELLRQQSVLR